MDPKKQFESQYHKLINLLISEINDDGFWTGRLSSSALSTSVAIVALKIKDEKEHRKQIKSGLNWLLKHVNKDGGFGDTPQSQSNASTSLLSYAAIHYCGQSEDPEKSALKNIENYLLTQNISLDPDQITSSVLQYYGKDYTFSVPILSMLVICGVMDERSCRNIPQLPFELVLLPSSWYSFLNLRVVSYALPALIAMGIFIFKKRKRHNPLMAFIRRKAIAPSLKKLSQIVPESGGFLEATPLTGFVAMCLISSGMNNHPVVTKGIEFLLNQQRTDGSWAIDTDLSTWVTTLSVKALSSDIPKFLPEDQTQKLRRHLLDLQSKERHAFNEALPGGWGWTNHSGSVPDVDDTCGAILALLETYRNSSEENSAIINGCKWLLSQQNSDGGFPTFCRGWGKLPFDSSCSDLTGHAFCALMSAVENMDGNIPEDLKKKFIQSASKGLEYLKRKQRHDGSWIPLWFGNQLLPDKSNPVYGTSKVAVYLSDCLAYQIINEETRNRLNSLLGNALNFLLTQQNDDGSWGGAHGIKGSIEETSLAVCALSGKYELQCIKGFQWLSEKFESQGIPSTPIGLYFAALWYDEQLYPLIYYIEALRRFHQKKI